MPYSGSSVTHYVLGTDAVNTVAIPSTGLLADEFIGGVTVPLNMSKIVHFVFAELKIPKLNSTAVGVNSIVTSGTDLKAVVIFTNETATPYPDIHKNAALKVGEIAHMPSISSLENYTFMGGDVIDISRDDATGIQLFNPGEYIRFYFPTGLAATDDILTSYGAQIILHIYAKSTTSKTPWWPR